MKCPYRPVTKISENITTTDFSDCYGTECPWYCVEKIMYDKYTVPASCMRCCTEHTNAQNESERNRR